MIKNYTNTEPHYDNSKEKKKKEKTSKHHSDKIFYIEVFQILHAGTAEHT